MIKVYTPKAWLSVFGGSPSLVINDDGYIYSADQYYRIFTGTPIGKIDYEKGLIYDKHYNDLFPTPIAYTTAKSDVIEIREYGKSNFSDPILYIKGDKLFTPEEYFRIFGGAASGYIKREEKGDDISGRVPAGKTNTYENSGAEAVGLFPRLAALLGVALLIGIIYILSDEGRLAHAAIILSLIVNGISVISLLYRVTAGKIHAAWNAKRFFMALLVGVGIYVGACVIYIILGLTSNIGTGHALSDQGEDQLELAALLLGVPAVLEGFFCAGPKPGTRNTTYQPSPGPTVNTVPPKTTIPPKTTGTWNSGAATAPPRPTVTPSLKTTMPKTTGAASVGGNAMGNAKAMVFSVMVEMFGQTAVFPDALIGRNTAEQADFMIRLPGYHMAAFFLVSDPSNTRDYRRAQMAGALWQNRGAYWFIVFEKDCQDPARIRQWLRSAMEQARK